MSSPEFTQIGEKEGLGKKFWKWAAILTAAGVSATVILQAIF